MGQPINIVGNRYGNLVVEKEISQKADHHRMFLCHCDCGEHISVRKTDLERGAISMCGKCLQRLREQKAHDELVGKKFNRLTVLRFYGRSKYGKYMYECRCDCGNFVLTTGTSIRRGQKSCGCAAVEAVTTHNLSKTRIYKIYHGIKKRCYNPECKDYAIYGKKGVRLCDEWLNDFQAFYDWSIANGYQDNLSIDRIDSNGNYEPNNCQWVDIIAQANNRSNNHYLYYNGETHTLAEWSRILKIDYSTLRDKVNKQNKSIKEIVEETNDKKSKISG